jgi:thiol-disulfide isomerase/thioredoxin
LTYCFFLKDNSNKDVIYCKEGDNLKTFVIRFFIFVFSVFFCQTIIADTSSIPSKGDTFPKIILYSPEKESEKDYLGFSGKGPFSLSQIQTPVIIVEIYSMYCPYCQKEAPLVNELYDIIQKNPGIKEKVKLIGIGAGNTPFEVKIYRNQYNIQFPLFPDEAFSIHKAVGEVRTPYFFVIKRNTDGSNNIIYSKVGSILDPHQFLEMILKESGLHQ